MKYKNTHVLETAWKQRAFDNRWMLLGKVFDDENKYSYQSAAGSAIHLIPTKWIILNVYDYLITIED